MDPTIDQITQILERTPRVLRAWLEGLDSEWTHRRYGEGTFSAYHVIGHLIIAERSDWIARTHIILAHGTSRPFDPFTHKATIEPEEGFTLAQLLDEFARLRRSNLDELRAMQITPAMMALSGTHPAFGEVTLGQLLATWATHDIHHTAQVAKAMAYQCKDAVGPWRAYLNTLPKE
jgi:uncharacterized damage-inducible protein DinB